MIRFLLLATLASCSVNFETTSQQSNIQPFDMLQVATHPTNSDVLLATSTFGVLYSKDGGVTVDWICRSTLGYEGTFEPNTAISDSGNLYVTSFEGLKVSTDDGCSWQAATGDIAGLWVEDVTVDTNGAVLAVTAANGSPNIVAKSTDGLSFTTVSVPDPDAFWRSIRVAKSDPQVIYIGGYKLIDNPPPDQPAVSPLIYRSGDGGLTWTAIDTSPFAFGQFPETSIAMISPTDPNLVYVHSPRENGESGSSLYRATDGVTFELVLTSLDFFSALHFGSNGTILAGTRTDGVKLSSDNGVTWTNASQQPQMGCVSETADGTWIGCGSNFEPDNFAIATSTDGNTWTNGWDFTRIQGPLPCLTQGQGCDGEWMTLDVTFNGGGEVDVPPPGKKGCCDSGEPTTILYCLAVGLILLRRPRNLDIAEKNLTLS